MSSYSNNGVYFLPKNNFREGEYLGPRTEHSTSSIVSTLALFLSGQNLVNTVMASF